MNNSADSRTLLQSVRSPVPKATTIGQRVYLVRLACGDGIRKAMPMREFAEVVGFHPSRISDIENNKSKPSLDEVEALAHVDPLDRGRSWIAWGDEDEMFTEITSGDDLRRAMDEPEADPKKKGEEDAG
jgi:transcriptional regulator with XRE-family HTH domain